MIGLDTLISTQTVISLTVSDQLEHLSPDDTLYNTVRIKNNHYRQKYPELPQPVVFMPVESSTFGRINEIFGVCCSFTPIGKIVICLENYKRSRFNFVSFELLVELLSRVLLG